VHQIRVVLVHKIRHMRVMCVSGNNRVAGSAYRATACIFWALGTFSYFQAHQEGRSSVCEYVEVLDQK